MYVLLFPLEHWLAHIDINFVQTLHMYGGPQLSRTIKKECTQIKKNAHK